MQQAKRVPPLQSFTAKALGALALAGLADFLFFGQPLGINLSLFFAALLGLYALANVQTVRQPRAALLLLLAMGTVLSLALRPSFLGFVVFTGFMGLAIFAPRRPVFDAWVTFKDIFKYYLTVFGFFRLGLALGRWRRRPARVDEGAGAFRLGYIVVPAVLGLMFLLFFASANPLWREVMSAFNIAALLDSLSMARLIFWSVVFAAALSQLRPRLYRPSHKRGAGALAIGDGFFSRRSVIYSLAFFNLIFALQNAMDATLFMDEGAVMAGGSFSQYARSGAYPLIATVLMAAGYVLFVYRRGHEKYQSRAARNLIYVWLGQNALLLGMAAARSLQYIAAYDLTILRLAALIWMAVIVAGLALTVIKIAQSRDNRWLVNANAYVLLAVLYASCFISYPRIVAEYNVSHAREATGAGQPLDMRYLVQDLGVDALPALIRYAELPGLSREEHALALLHVSHLRRRMQAGTGQAPAAYGDMEGWQQYGWRRATLRDLWMAARYDARMEALAAPDVAPLRP